MSSSRFGRLARSLWRNLRERDWQVTGKRAGYRALQAVNVVCAVHLCAEHVGFIHMVYGPSMVPTMSPTGECVLESRLISPHRLSRGDLVTYISPLEPSRIVCKRVIGLPGDIVCVDPTGMLAPSTEHVVIPTGHLWMSGDNAEMSRDSRYYGPVSMALVKGKLIARIWPFRDACFFQNNFKYLDS